jgi:hypothetical protein
MKRVISVEFNELSPILMDRFIAEGMLPNFARLREQSVTAVTNADAELEWLEPWVQWVDIHTGVDYRKHGAFRLNEGATIGVPRVWDYISDAGGEVWVCGSMNAEVQQNKINGHILPDPWAADLQPYPNGFAEPFYKFVKASLQEYTKDRANITFADQGKFVAFMVQHGLSPATVISIIKQLAGERGGLPKWRRTAILDRLYWDLFRNVLQKRRPQFSSLFLNSTAHLQHCYWRYMEPEKFELKPSAKDVELFGDAIPYGYRCMDVLVGELLDIVDDETIIVFATGLSQQPMLNYEDSGGKQTFRIDNTEKFFSFAGINSAYRYEPVMAEEFYVAFDKPADAEDARARLLSLQMEDGSPVMRVSEGGDSRKIFGGCAIIVQPPPAATVRSQYTNKTLPFAELFNPAQERMKSGKHHPEGMLWIRGVGLAPKTMERKVKLTEIAPTILALCGIKPPSHLEAPIAEVALREIVRGGRTLEAA